MADTDEPRVHVISHDGDNKDETGVAAILRAFMHNPAGAVQIIAFVGGMYGLYYAIQGEITDVRAAQVGNYEKLNAGLSVLNANEADERSKVDAMYTRSDTRYNAIIAKLSSHDVDIAKIVAGIDYLIDERRNGGAPAAPPRIQLTPVSPVP